MLQVHQALDALASADSEKALIVKLRFFVGLSHEEIAALLGVNEKTVRRHWEVARCGCFKPSGRRANVLMSYIGHFHARRAESRKHLRIDPSPQVHYSKIPCRR